MPLKVSIIHQACLHAGWSLRYKHTAELMCLDFCRPAVSHITPQLMEVSTPLVLEAWDQALATHPDQAYARYIRNGLRQGFRIGFQHGKPLKSASRNMPSTDQHPESLDEYIHKELSKGRMLGPFPNTVHLPPIHINRVGSVPKGHGSNKRRVITDLSFPMGSSVNDGVDPALCSMAYISVDDVAALVAQLGKGTLLAKVDIESAYRLIPVHPQDRVLQAIEWKGQIYIDPMLPFGLRSAPKIFNAVADALSWHLEQSGILHILHYLDDYIIIAPPDSPLCQLWLDTLLRECRRLGVPIAGHKTDGPTTCLEYLGIVIDTLRGELRLSAEKLQRLRDLLREWRNRTSCTRKELESLIGLLNHACKVVRSGRSFLRRMIDLLHAIHHPPNSKTPIRLNAGFRADLAWWQEFLVKWNGVSFLHPPSRLPTIELTTDASGSWGCGAWHGSDWFQVRWDDRSAPLTIAEKELIPIILACEAWGATWYGQRVLCHCDNEAVVACLRSRSSKQKGIMHLLRCLVFLEAWHQCFLYPTYINTKANHLADDLSRDNAGSFLSKVPWANPHPSLVSYHLLHLLLDQQADWTCPHWRRQFSAISSRD